MLKKLMKVLNFAMCGVLIFQLVGCGTILYPERKGQKDGRLDVGIVLLDGIGLLFFLIPGVIAYAVDFSNGTIYLPGGLSSTLDGQNIREVKFDSTDKSMANIERIIKRETGCDVKLYSNDMQVVKLESADDIKAHFAEALPKIQNTRVVLLSQ